MTHFSKIFIIIPAFILLGSGCDSVGDDIVQKSSSDTEVIAERVDVADPFKDRNGETVSGITKVHVVGKSSCPDPLPPITLESNGTQTVGDLTLYTDAKWLDLPKTVAPGESFTAKFNCNIQDFSTHDENATITYEYSTPELENAPSKTHGVLSVRMSICDGVDSQCASNMGEGDGAWFGINHERQESGLMNR